MHNPLKLCFVIILIWFAVVIDGQCQVSGLGDGIKPCITASTYSDDRSGIGLGIIWHKNSKSSGYRLSCNYLMDQSSNKWILGPELAIQQMDSLHKWPMMAYRELGFGLNGLVDSDGKVVRTFDYQFGSGLKLNSRHISQTLIITGVFRIPLNGQPLNLENVFVGGLKVLFTLR